MSRLICIVDQLPSGKHKVCCPHITYITYYYILLKKKCQYFGHIIRGNGVQRLLMEGRINGRRGRGDREQCGLITSRNGQKCHIMTVSEWHKNENDGDP